MRTLVTGGAGMIGAYVVAELARSGHEVIVMDQVRPREPVAGVHYRLANHEDLGEVVALCAGLDAIVHLSAIPAPRSHPDTLIFRSNVMGTFNVHEAAVIAGVPLVVSASSQSAYGFAWQHRPFYPQYLPLDEAHPDLSQDAVVADDALAMEPLADLLSRLDPVLGAMATALTGRQGMISGDRIRQVLGFQPMYSWRDVLDEE